MHNFWTACGHQHLTRNARGWMCPTPDYWRLWLQRPELALVPHFLGVAVSIEPVQIAF